jgi:hypothetical protein
MWPSKPLCVFVPLKYLLLGDEQDGDYGVFVLESLEDQAEQMGLNIEAHAMEGAYPADECMVELEYDGELIPVSRFYEDVPDELKPAWAHLFLG